MPLSPAQLREAAHRLSRARLEPPTAIAGSMQINGREVGTGFGRDIINGHPLAALGWLANHQSERGTNLPAGWLVMLGSVVQTKWVAKGDRVQVDVEGLGTAVAQF